MALALVLRLAQIGWGLPEIYEEATPLSVAWKMWNWGHPGFDLNPHFFNYPALVIYLNFLVQVVYAEVAYVGGWYANLNAFHQAFLADPSQMVIAARLVSVLFDTGTVVVLFLLAKELFGRRAGYVAAVLSAVDLLMIRQAHLINVDTVLTFFAALSLFCIYWSYVRPDVKTYILAGIFIGCAAACKYNGALLLPVLAASHIVSFFSARQPASRPSGRFLLFALIASACTFLLLNPYIVLNFSQFLKDFSFEEMHMSAGHLGLDPNVSSSAYYLLRVLPSDLGWSIYGITVISLCALFFRRNRPQILFSLFPIIYVAVICTWNMRAERYILPALPALLVIASWGISSAWSYASVRVKQRITGLTTPRKVLAVSLTMLAAVSALLAQPALGLARYYGSFSLPDTRRIAKEWILQNIPHGAVIGTIPVGITLPESTYRLFPIPFLAVNPERVAPFYDPRWFEDFDLVIGSSLDYGRYAADPLRYGDFLRYYDTLRARWNLAFEITPAESQPGPAIWLFRPPPNPVTLFDHDLLSRLQDAPESTRVSAFLKNMAATMIIKKKEEKAVQLLKEITSVEAGDFGAHRTLAAFYFGRREYDDALTEFQICLKLHPGDADLLAQEGSSLLGLQRFPEAEICLKQAIQANRYLESAYDDLLRIYVVRRDKAKALDILSRHLAIVPQNSAKAELIMTDIQTLRRIP